MKSLVHRYIVTEEFDICCRGLLRVCRDTKNTQINAYHSDI